MQQRSSDEISLGELRRERGVTVLCTPTSTKRHKEAHAARRWRAGDIFSFINSAPRSPIMRDYILYPAGIYPGLFLDPLALFYADCVKYSYYACVHACVPRNAASHPQITFR